MSELNDKAEAIISRTGRSRDGAPLALQREPPASIAPWFYWVSLAAGTVPDGQVARCGTLGDHPCIRLLFGGKWTFEMEGGTRTLEPGPEGMTLYFGPQTRFNPVSMAGDYAAITMHYTAGAMPCLGGPNQKDMLDRIIDYDAMVGHGRLTSRIPVDEPYALWFDALLHEMGVFVERLGPKPPDPIITQFERESLASPDFTVAAFAEANAIPVRTLERKILRNYGVGPKFALRRARALDMAAMLLGVNLPREAVEMEQRYYDQSHQIREMKTFFGMTPTELQGGVHPILRVNMEARQNRRLRSLNEIGPDDPRPWRDPNFEPD